MRLASVMSMAVIVGVTGPYIMVHGFKAAIPLVLTAVLSMIWAVMT